MDGQAHPVDLKNPENRVQTATDSPLARSIN